MNGYENLEEEKSFAEPLRSTVPPRTAAGGASSVAVLNEYCQQHQLALPVYSYTRVGEQTFTCTCTIPGVDPIVATSTGHPGKKSAKVEAAAAAGAVLEARGP